MKRNRQHELFALTESIKNQQYHLQYRESNFFKFISATAEPDSYTKLTHQFFRLQSVLIPNNRCYRSPQLCSEARGTPADFSPLQRAYPPSYTVLLPPLLRANTMVKIILLENLNFHILTAGGVNILPCVMGLIVSNN